MKLPKLVDDNLVLLIAMGVCAVLLVGLTRVHKPCCECKAEEKKVNSN
jgi:hypothetical protein